MGKGEVRRINIIRLFLFLSCIFYVPVFWVRIPQAYGFRHLLGFSGSRLLQLSPLFIGFIISAGLVGISFTTPWRARLLRWAESIRIRLPCQPLINWLFFILCLVTPLAYLSAAASDIDKYLPFWWLFGHLVLLGSLFFYANWRKISLAKSLVITALSYTCVYLVVFTLIQQVSNYPLTIGWSEASSYYNASLFFARRIYGASYPLPVLDPGRFMLLAIPFLAPNLPLWVHRLWQAMLWIGLTWAAGAALARRLKLTSTLTALTVSAFAFLFLFQGPFYYHLALVATIVLLGFRSDRLYQSSIVVLLASVWAGLTRLNWFPIPGLLAVVLYVLEKPLVGKSWWRYGLMPLVWVAVGTLVAFVSRDVYNVISNNPSVAFYSNLKYPLLWYRLWPNATFRSGIILGFLWVVFPIAAFLVGTFWRSHKSWHTLRTTTLLVVLMTLLAGGILVSVRIGGGSNLHDLDAFWMVLLVVAGYLYFDRFVPDGSKKGKPSKLTWVWMTLAVIIPVTQFMGNIPVVPKIPPDYQNQLAALQDLLDQAHQQGGKVLFVTQRQLVTFGSVHGVEMQPEYERVMLMEMAMAGNEGYLRDFESDLENHRYALIIFEPLTGVMQTSASAFAEENNAWLARITGPLMDNYHMQKTFDALDIAVLDPCPEAGCTGK